MGNGSSLISDPQRADIAQKLKERYETETAAGKSESDLQAVLSKYYEDLLNGHLGKENVIKGGSLPQGKKIKKKSVPRRRSFDNSKHKDMPPRPPAKAVAASGVPPPVNEPVSATLIVPEDVVDGTEQGQSFQPEVDSWDSVRAQPVCLLCKMIFPTESKLETHLKYSEYHASNVKKHADETERQRRMSEPRVAEPPGNRCRELYSGSKFFWRQKETVEINIFLHIALNCVEVCCYNNHSATEYNRLYFNHAAIFAYFGDEAMKSAVESRKESMAEEDLALTDEFIEEEERRLAVSSHLIPRLNLTVRTPEDPLMKMITYRFSPSLVNQSASSALSPLLDAKPPELTPVLVPRRRLSSAEEIESVIQNIANIEASLQSTTQAAANVVDKLLDSNAKLFASGIASCHGSTPVAAIGGAEGQPIEDVSSQQHVDGESEQTV